MNYNEEDDRLKGVWINRLKGVRIKPWVRAQGPYVSKLKKKRKPLNSSFARLGRAAESPN